MVILPCRTARLQAAQTMAEKTPNTTVIIGAPSVATASLRGLSRNIVYENVARQSVFLMDPPPTLRSELELIETTVLFAR